MRYLDEVVFIEETEERYDPDLGEYVGGQLIETPLDANVTDLGSDRSIALFGDVQENSKVIRLQPYQMVPKFDYLTIEGVTYKSTKDLRPQNRKTLIVKEFING